MKINLKEIQNTIGYNFKNEYLLEQAFTRRSYTEENGGYNNEVLEFVGDKALEIAIVSLMMDWYTEFRYPEDDSVLTVNHGYLNSKMQEGQLTEIKQKLVQKKTLAMSIEDLGFQKYLKMSFGDIITDVECEYSVMEDLFEAIIGAIAIDSNWNVLVIKDVVSTMIDFDNFLNDSYEDNFVIEVQEWCSYHTKELPAYKYEKTSENEYDCTVEIKDVGLFSGTGKTKAIARMKTAREIYGYLSDKGLIENMYAREIRYPAYEASLSQLNELYQKRMISKPEFECEEVIQEDGSIGWFCICKVKQCREDNKGYGSTKKEAKKQAAYWAVCDLTDMYEY